MKKLDWFTDKLSAYCMLAYKSCAPINTADVWVNGDTFALLEDGLCDFVRNSTTPIKPNTFVFMRTEFSLRIEDYVKDHDAVIIPTSIK
jgi:hypothetical protein